MGVSKSITIEGATFRFEVKSNDGVMHVSLYSGDGESAHAIMTAEDSKEVVEALDMGSRVGEAAGKQTLYGAGA